jgi:glycosyltransferase involved in cell wall biosynthesis
MGGGGAERQFIYLTRGLVGKGWRVAVVVTHEGPNYEDLQHSGATIYRPAVTTNYDPRLFFRIARIIRDERPSVVQTWLLQMDVFGGLAALHCGVPWVLAERSNEVGYSGSMKYKLRETLALRASVIVANSQGGDSYWSKQTVAGRIRRVIPNGVPLEEIDDAQSFSSGQIGIPDDTQVILLAGRWAPEKNWDALLPALRPVLRGGRRIAVLCGDGVQSAENLRQLLAEHGPERVRVLGYVRDIWRWMKRANVFISVGSFEGRPNTVLEAMANGCPLVVSDIPAHREFLDGSTALFVNPRDSASIVRGVELCLADPETTRARSARARAIVRQWSVTRMVAQYERIYHGLMGRDRILRNAKS